MMTTTKTIPAPDWMGASLAVERASRLLLVTHVNPDGDAIGSLLGLGNVLRMRGKQVTLAVDGGVPDFLQFLPGSETVLAALSEGDWEVMIALDSSDEERIGRCGAYGMANSALVINCDHHPSNTLFGDLYLIQADAVSTTEILQTWFVKLGQPLTYAIATPLLTGLITDTMGFRTSSASGHTLALAKALIDAGAPLYEVTERTLNGKPYRAIALWQRILPSVRFEDGVVYALVRKADWQESGFFDETTAGLVSYLIATDEPIVAVTFTEDSDDNINLSMRCKLGYDVSGVALSLGGGGHKQAAGATIEGPLETAVERVLPLLKAVAQGN